MAATESPVPGLTGKHGNEMGWRGLASPPPHAPVRRGPSQKWVSVFHIWCFQGINNCVYFLKIKITAGGKKKTTTSVPEAVAVISSLVSPPSSFLQSNTDLRKGEGESRLTDILNRLFCVDTAYSLGLDLGRGGVSEKVLPVSTYSCKESLLRWQ